MHNRLIVLCIQCIAILAFLQSHLSFESLHLHLSFESLQLHLSFESLQLHLSFESLQLHPSFEPLHSHLHSESLHLHLSIESPHAAYSSSDTVHCFCTPSVLIDCISIRQSQPRNCILIAHDHWTSTARNPSIGKQSAISLPSATAIKTNTKTHNRNKQETAGSDPSSNYHIKQ